jgi:hypothetical protein
MASKHSTYKLFPELVDVSGAIVDMYLNYGPLNMMELYDKFDEHGLFVQVEREMSKSKKKSTIYLIKAMRESQMDFVRKEWEGLLADKILKIKRIGNSKKAMYNERVVVESVKYSDYLATLDQSQKQNQEQSQETNQTSNQISTQTSSSSP